MPPPSPADHRAPSLVGLGRWTEVHTVTNLQAVFDVPDHGEWQALREAGCARFVYLAAPRFLGRAPDDGVQPPIVRAACWVNSAYLMAMNIVRAFGLYGWLARMRGLESGGAWEDLPIHEGRSDDGSRDPTASCEVSIGYASEAELASQGLMPVLHPPLSNLTAFVGARSLHRPSRDGDVEQQIEADLGGRLSWLLCGCRFARALERIAALRGENNADAERRLLYWMLDYVDGDPASSSESTQARRPLASADLSGLEMREGSRVSAAALEVRPNRQFNGAHPTLRFRVEWLREF